MWLKPKSEIMFSLLQIKIQFSLEQSAILTVTQSLVKILSQAAKYAMDDKLKIVAVVSKKVLRKFKRSSKQHIMSNLLKVCFIKKCIFYESYLCVFRGIFLHFV